MKLNFWAELGFIGIETKATATNKQKQKTINQEYM
jgi:hypothetical protein